MSYLQSSGFSCSFRGKNRKKIKTSYGNPRFEASVKFLISGEILLLNACFQMLQVQVKQKNPLRLVMLKLTAGIKVVMFRCIANTEVAISGNVIDEVEMLSESK